MRWQKLLSSLHDRLAASSKVTALAVKVRNQCNLIISKRFGLQNMSPHLNGEYLLLKYVMPFCKTFFDIGANKGEWTNYVIYNEHASKKQFYLYEPGNAAFAILLDRFKETDNISVFNVAVSDSSETILFYETDNAGELSSAIEGWGEGPTLTIEVNTTTIDHEIEKLRIDYLDFIKIDTEGFDLKVLKGATQAIKNKKIGFIQFEYNSAWAMTGATLNDAYNLLKSNGYEVFLLKPDGLYDYNIKKYGEFYVFSNFVAILPNNIQYVRQLIKGAA